MTNQISFIYFDIGGVLIKDFSCSDKWVQMKLDLGVSAAQSEEFDQIWDELAEARVCLDYDVEQLVPIFKQRLGLNLGEDYSHLQDFVDRFERNESIWPLIDQLRHKFKFGLLTNMFPGMLDKIKASGLIDDVRWDVVVDSSLVGMQKPDHEIFFHAQKEVGVAADQILFIDNTQGHLDSAASLGWQTHYFNSCDYEESTKILRQLLDKF